MLKQILFTDYTKLLSTQRTSLMGMAIMLVVLYHQDWFTVNIWGYIKQFGYLGVEIFLLVSGYGIVHSLQRNTFKKFYGNRVLRLLPACITYGIMKLIISQFIPFPQSGLCFIWDLLSITHWYIYAIILYYLFSPYIYIAIKKYGWTILLIVSISSYIALLFWHDSADMHYFLKYGRWIVKRLPVFVLGMTLALNPITHWRVLCVSFFSLILNILIYKYIVTLNYGVASDISMNWVINIPNMKDIPDGGRYLLDMLSVLVIIQILGLINTLFKKIKIDKIWIILGTYSLEIYLCHQIIFNLFYTESNISRFSQVFFSIILVLFFSFLIKLIAGKLQLLLEYLFHRQIS